MWASMYIAEKVPENLLYRVGQEEGHKVNGEEGAGYGKESRGQ